MTLPRGDEYQEAVQSPKAAFMDAELRACNVETTPLGLPKPYAGGFTTTYQLQGTSQNWAVRCFTREIPDLQVRYQTLSRFLARNPSEYFVDANCLNQGIRIGSNWYPIIKMIWIKGDPLNIFVGNKIATISQISRLAEGFKVLVQALENLGIAHGDLQHGNIIVKNGKLYLIDYDGIYLPELSLRTNEIGHINYQHPGRNGSHYDARIDRFSSIVIYLGLFAISVAPTLWRKYDNSENILFRRDDFTDTEKSPLLADLIAYPQLVSLVERFKGVCNLEFDKIPTLNQFITGTFTYSKIFKPIATSYQLRSQYPILDASQLASLREHIGERAEVIGLVTDHHGDVGMNHKRYLFLNFGPRYPNQTFTLVFWSKVLNVFKDNKIDPKQYIGKWLSITGVISIYEGKPQMVVEIPSQIQILDENAARQKFLAPSSNLRPEWLTSAAQAILLDSMAITKPPPENIPKSSNQVKSAQSASYLSEDVITRSDAKALNDLWGDSIPILKSPNQSAVSSSSTATGNLNTSNTQPSSLQAKPIKAIPSPISPPVQMSTLSKQDAEKLTSLYGSGKPKTNKPTNKLSTSKGSLIENRNKHEKVIILLIIGISIIFLLAIGVVAIIIIQQIIDTNQQSQIPVVSILEVNENVSTPTRIITFTHTPAAQKESTSTLTLLPTVYATGLASLVQALGCAETNLNVRDGPGMNYQVIDWLLMGDCVIFNARKGDGSWLRIAPGQTIKKGWTVSSRVILSEVSSLPLLIEDITTPIVMS